MSVIRRHYADYVIYQSHYSLSAWTVRFGPSDLPHTVIHNGVDVSNIPPPTTEQGSHTVELLVVEGTLGDPLQELQTPIAAWELLQEQDPSTRLTLLGRVHDGLEHHVPADERVSALGSIPREEVRAHMQRASVLISCEIFPACPNSVIEALAAGLPVVAFDTGSASELVGSEAGAIVQYGSDPAKPETPDIPGLVNTIKSVVAERPIYSQKARERAIANFDAEMMIDRYISAFETALPSKSGST